MRYFDLTKSLKRPDVVESIRSHLHLIEKTSEDKIFVNGELTDFISLEEARQHIKSEYNSRKLEEQVSKELYEEISETTVAALIREHHDVKVTDTLIEKYINLASSHTFTVDPVIQEIRSMNKLDRLVEGKLHYVLDDHSIVAIDEATQSKLNSILREQNEVIEYMRTSKENFLNALDQIKDKDGDR
jgi:hypothetical protein